MFKFEHKSETGSIQITHAIADGTWPEVLSSFLDFLTGCGYMFDRVAVLDGATNAHDDYLEEREQLRKLQKQANMEVKEFSDFDSYGDDVSSND